MKKTGWITLALLGAMLVACLAIPRPGGSRSLLASMPQRVYLPIVRRRARPSRPPLCPGEQPPLITDQQVYQTPPRAEPPARVPFRDPVFRTCVVRVTDRNTDISADDSSQGLKNEYSRVQSFNADGSYSLTPLHPEDPANWVDEPCRLCGAESRRVICLSPDARYHHHGKTHAKVGNDTNELLPICGSETCKDRVSRSWKGEPILEKELLPEPEWIID